MRVTQTINGPGLAQAKMHDSIQAGKQSQETVVTRGWKKGSIMTEKRLKFGAIAAPLFFKIGYSIIDEAQGAHFIANLEPALCSMKKNIKRMHRQRSAGLDADSEW